MFVRIGNTPRDYAWGSTTAIAELLGTEPSGKAEAELWLGAHAGSPSTILDPGPVGGAHDLAEWIDRDPVTALGVNVNAQATAGDADTARLPFLLKVLAAAGPLSLQAHPSPAQARAGFDRENAEGIPLDSPKRNFKDPLHKPELIYALSPTFEALCGFRAVTESLAVFDALVAAAGDASDVSSDAQAALAGFRDRLASGASGASGAGDSANSADSSGPVLRDAVAWLLAGGADVDTLVAAVVRTAAELAVEPVGALAEAYPGDPGVVLSLLLNHVTLRRGEALYLPAGNIHAYLSGLGIELMAASDNVLRGGLTPKHIDVPELLAVLDFSPIAEPRLAAETTALGVEVFRPDVPDFALVHIELGGDIAKAKVPLPGPAIVLCVDGVVEVIGAGADPAVAVLRKGESVYVTPDEVSLRFTGTGSVFLATSNGSF
ncbi:MAG: mannose-6-phosphate isomerase [Microbacteriaceae bacterium]|jgi:mannose-6-phosphate isomerase|nr:mannose-6-phosphate isomerase [Microbacteriaceae bacterium]